MYKKSKLEIALILWGLSLFGICAINFPMDRENWFGIIANLLTQALFITLVFLLWVMMKGDPKSRSKFLTLWGILFVSTIVATIVYVIVKGNGYGLLGLTLGCLIAHLVLLVKQAEQEVRFRRQQDQLHE